MDEAQWQRLLEEQQAAIGQTQSKLDQLEKFKRDYEVLETRLQSLPERITHDVMVPFGKVAFMPGQLIHTNEIMVLLGDNWFVERSAKQAAEIVHRRIEGLTRQTDELKQQRELLIPRADFTSQLKDLGQKSGEVFEIQEEYDEEKEKQWKDMHRKRMRDHREDLRKTATRGEKPSEDAKSEAREKTDEEIWARLDQLHQQEMRGGELAKLSEEDPAKTVMWKDAMKSHKDDNDSEDDDDDDDDEDNDDRKFSPRSITFSHTPVTEAKKTEETDQIMSPADIYRLYETKPKSILKAPSSSFPEKLPSSRKTAPVNPKTIVHVDQGAFSENVMERSFEGQTSPDSSQQTSQQPQKRVSRFKARQQAKQSDS